MSGPARLIPTTRSLGFLNIDAIVTAKQAEVEAADSSHRPLAAVIITLVSGHEETLDFTSPEQAASFLAGLTDFTGSLLRLDKLADHGMIHVEAMKRARALEDIPQPPAPPTPPPASGLVDGSGQRL